MKDIISIVRNGIFSGHGRRHSLSSPSSTSGFLQFGFGITPTPKLRPVTPVSPLDSLRFTKPINIISTTFYISYQLPADGDPLADTTPVILRPLRPGYHASHLDPWKAVASKKLQPPPAEEGRTVTGAAAAERRQDGGEESKEQN